MRVSTRRNAARVAAATSVALLVPLVVATESAEAAPAGAPAAVSAAAPAKNMTRAQVKHRRAVHKRAALVKFAKKKKGTGQYVAGASRSNAFDCSGFTKLIYRKVAKINLPHYSAAQMHRAKRVSKRHLKRGDLLFWGPGARQHVSMYIGGGKMIGANNPRSDVQIEGINGGYWRPRYHSAGRLIQG